MSFVHWTRDGSITGSGLTQFWPTAHAGILGSTDTLPTFAGGSMPQSWFPLDTTVERAEIRNSTNPGSTISYDFLLGGVAIGSTVTIPSGGDRFGSTELGNLCAAPLVDGDLSARRLALRGVVTSFSTLLPHIGLKYEASDQLVSWTIHGGSSPLGSVTSQFLLLTQSAPSGASTESDIQVPWPRGGVLKNVLVVGVFQSGAGDKTYTWDLRVNGASVISLAKVNTSTSIFLVRDVTTEFAVVAGDLISARVGMSGGFTAGRNVLFNLIFGFKAS